MVVIKTSSKTARNISGVGRSYVVDNKNKTMSPVDRSGNGGSEQTIAVNPITYEPDSNSTFRVYQSEVGRPPAGSKERTSYTSGAGINTKNSPPTPNNNSTSSTSINPIIKSLIRGEVSLADVKSGRARAFETTVTPSEAQVLARQSLRQDVDGYKFSGVTVDANQSVDLEAKRRNENILFKSNKSGRVVGESNPVKQQSVLYQSGELKQSKSQEFLFGKKEAVGFTSRSGTTVNVMSSSRGVVGRAKDFGTGIKTSVVDPVVSFGRGTVKLLNFEAENPNRGGIGSWNPSGKQIENNLAQKNAKLKTLFESDSDVRTATVGGGLLLSFPISTVPVTVVGGVQSIKGGYNIIGGLFSDDFKKVGGGVGDVLTGELTLKSVKRPFIEFSKTKVKAEDVFGGELSGRKVTSTSTKEALGQFEAGRLSDGKIEVVSASPSSLKGGKLVDIGAGAKGSAGLEDSGLFVGPKSRANLMFTGLGKESGDSSLTINPVTQVKRFFGSNPVVSGIVVSDVVTPSKSVLIQAGFLNTNKEFVGEGVAVITKRSMIGKGEIAPQLFSPVQDFTSKGGMVRLKGKRYMEGGTSETEAVIPTGSVLKKVSNKEFTVINQKKFFGRDVPLTGDLIELPKYELVSGKKSGNINKANDKSLFDAKDIGLIDSNSMSSFRSGKSRNAFSGVGSYGESNIGSSKNFLSSTNSVVAGSGFSNRDFDVSVTGLSRKSISNSFGNVISSTSSNFLGSSLRPFGKSSSLVSGGKSTSSTSKVIGGSLFSGSSLRGSSLKTIKSTLSPPLENNPKRNSGDNRFSVDVRSKGMFVSVGQGLNLKDAVKLGKSLTGSSSARSFKIKTQAGKSLTGLNLGGDYYKKGDVYIEKSGSAINTGGELKQITFKGIATQRRKSLGVF